MHNVGIVLYTTGINEKNLKTSLKSFNHIKDNVVIVSDGELVNKELVKGYNFKEFKRCLYPSACYNYGIREHLKNDNIEYIFIINDNISILDDSVYTDYINAAKQTNIGLFVSCTNEDDPYGKSDNLRLTIAIKDGYSLTLNKGFNGNLIMLNKKTIELAGFFDERYKGAFEVGDYYKKCSDVGITVPYGWFVDVKNVEDNLLYQTNLPTKTHETMNQQTLEDRMIRGMKVFHMKYKAQFNELLNIYTANDVISKIKSLASRSFE